jgi:hypothetical protein
VSVPDDSDGVLSLALRWEAEWDEREKESLPPEWMRLEVPELDGGEMEEGEEEKKGLREGDLLAVNDDDDDDEGKEGDNGIIEVKKKIIAKSLHFPRPTSLRFRLGSLPSTSPALLLLAI